MHKDWVNTTIEEFVEFNRKLGAGLAHFTELGDVDVGISPKQAVYREDKLTLFRYERPDTEPRIPLLVVYALVNRPYMADLQPDRSLIRGLLAAGIDVYLIDWGYPDAGDRSLTLENYICGYVDHCVDFIRSQHEVDDINLLGICQGGTFSLCYGALYREKVKNLVTMVTPVDFHTADNVLSRWLRHIDIDLLVDTLGNVPGDFLNWIFLSLKPYRLTSQKYVDLIDIIDRPEKLKNFVRMEKWIFDSPDQAGEAFRQFIKEFFKGNKLVKGNLTIGSRKVDLSSVTMPVLNIYATADHLVPPSSSKALRSLVGSSDYDEVVFDGGHIGIYVSGRAQRQIPAAIGSWLAEHNVNAPGS